jgi:predicted RecB family nuclease
MDTGINISAAIFSAYLKCATKAYLMAKGEKAPNTFFADMRERISAAYKAKANQRLRTQASGIVPINFLRLGGNPFTGTATIFVDCEAASYVDDEPASVRLGRRTKGTELGSSYVPTVYSAWNKSDQSDDLLVCFGGLAIEQVTRTELPSSGKVIYGEGYRSKTVKIDDHLPKVRHVLQAIGAVCRASKPPPLRLNKHCVTCDFQSRCRLLAVEQDDLSLLDAMTVKERTKYAEKAISTITQLSYGYRPRRRRRTKSTDCRSHSPIKHDHKLKALAITKAQTHVVGSPTLSIEGTPVFMDVEGLPDRKFYYLIGIRYTAQGEPIERSFWADGPEAECDIWQECLRALREIENPILVHYGAYESRFLSKMRTRWKPTAEDAELCDRIASQLGEE